MKIQNKIKGCYLGWFFGSGAILRKELSDNYQNIQKNPEYNKVKDFNQIPSDYKMYDQLTQTLIVQEILMEHGKITPELFKNKLLELNEKDDVLNNDQYGPSTMKAIKNLLAGKNPRETGKGGLTTGGAMRCMPIGVYFNKNSEKILTETYESCLISHNTDVAINSAQAVNLMIANLLNGKTKKQALEKATFILNKNYGKYGEPTATAYIHERINDAVKLVKGKSFEEATEIIAKKIGFSWYAIEGIPAGFAIYFATKNAKEAALMGFKIGYNHTAPEIACAFHGAEKGPKQFPKEIVKKIEETNNFSIENLYNKMINKLNPQ